MNLIEHRTYKLILTKADLKKMIGRYHFRDTDFLSLERQYKRIENYVFASVTYKVEEDNRTTFCAVTLGDMFDALQDNCTKKGDMSAVYQMECLGMELLNKAYQELETTILEEKGLFIKQYNFPTQEELLLKSNVFLKKLQVKEIRTTKKGVLIPKKSVFYRAIVSKQEGSACGDICANCTNKMCENRCRREKARECKSD